MTSRSHPASSGPGERLVDAYLADLERALRDVDAEDHDEVVASVREHIDTALSEHDGEPTPRDVEALLLQLGPVERIAQDVDGGVGRSHSGAENTRPKSGSVILALAVVSLVFVFVPFVAVPLAPSVSLSRL